MPHSSITSLLTLVAPELVATRQYLLDLMPAHTKPLMESVGYSLGVSGKMIRPAMALLTAKALQETHSDSNQAVVLPKKMIALSAVAEMIHLATLLHDDVLDEADLRRGQATTRFQFGNKLSILSGDWLLARASQTLAEIGHLRIVRIFSDVLAFLCDGEALQNEAAYSLASTTWAYYNQKTFGKTASLFAATMESVGVLYGCEEPVVQALRQYGESFGIAFQLIDDLLDYTQNAETLGKPALSDLKQGLANAPILLALESERLSLAERDRLKTAIERLFQLCNPENGNKQDLAEQDALCLEIQASILRSSAVEATQKLAYTYLQQAEKSLAVLPESPAKAVLKQLLAFNQTRKT
jgi:all-trans-nonaprenyl-diphosphate synthase